MDERRRRQAAGRTDRTQSAREIDNNGQERAPRRRGWHTAGRVIGTILLVMVLTMAIFAGIFSAYINSSMRGNVEVYLDEFESKVSTELYYQEPSTEEWTMYQTLFLDSENRIWANLDQIPKNLQEAVVAIEDKRFYKHHGVDWYGTARAILSTLFGGNVQGGSTITQQLVKNVTGDNQNTVKRKVTEIYRALDLEKRYEKDEILEAYLNEVYFGRSCYGVVTASLTYFDKDVSELTLAECASLISITNNPSLYDPLRADWSRENNRERQLLVLGALYEQGTIDQATYEAAKAEEVVFADGYTIQGNYVGSDESKKNTTGDNAGDTTGDTVGGDTQEDTQESTATASQSYFTDAVIDDVEAVLGQAFNYKADSFAVTNMESLLDMMHDMQNMMQTMLAGIASIALLVGGIGIMNMMLVSVTERTTEIGLRKALGAQPKRIQMQFLTEAIFLSLFGGIIGIVVGLLISLLVALAIDVGFAISLSAIALGVGFSVLVGVVFGLAPARKASRLNPIDALRSV